MSRLAVTVVGHDRPGIIAATATALAGCGMNLEDSTMTLLQGHFAMTLVCAGGPGVAQVEAALAGLAAPDLAVTVHAMPAETDRPPAGAAHLVTVHGADRLGIVARLAGTLADLGGNITDLTTRLTGDLYVLLAEVDLPPSLATGELRRRVAAVAAELGVDVTVRPLTPDDL